MKLQAGHVQDPADVTRMLGQASDEALDAVRRLFPQFALDEVEDLDSLIALGRMETDSPQQGSSLQLLAGLSDTQQRGCAKSDEARRGTQNG